MRTLISHYPGSHFLFHFPSLKWTTKKPNLFSHKKSNISISGCTIFRSVTASCTANSSAFYNGWDDLRIRVDSDDVGESNQIKKFLFLLGFDDKKYVLTCILGFVCALALSRVRVSSLFVLPGAAIIFAIGFSFGIVNGKPHKGFVNGAKKRVKEETLRVYVEKLKGLVDLFDGFDVRVSELKNDIKKAIVDERVGVSDLEGYVDVVESIGGLVLNARNVVEGCIDSVSNEGQEVEKNLFQKQGRKRKAIENNGFNWFGFVGSFLSDNLDGSKSSKTNAVRRDGGARLNSVATKDSGSPSRGSSNVDANGKTKIEDRNQEMERILRRGQMGRMETYMNTKTFLDDDELNYQNVRFMNDRRVSLNMSAYREVRNWVSHDSMSSNTGFDFRSRPLESEASSEQQIFQKSNGSYEFSRDRENPKYESYRASLGEEMIDIEDEPLSRKYQSPQGDGIDSFSTVSDDVLFDEFLTRANDLLKQAKECLKVRNNEMLAEDMLRESAKLLSQAIAMKPMSLLAVGQLGNIYLLHGKLKLRTSRELRKLLATSGDFGVERPSNLLNPVDEILPSKDRIATRLVNVCEECESLLVEAGRTYRTALAIDGNDLRALYNWGLALSFRAQLVADIGPEAAHDADKLFLAAIDKFDAMMSRSNVYAPEALFRWGAALQQRSRLRPSNTRDKVKLLQQAKRLYEDALSMDSRNLQVREALSSCMSELDFTDL